MTPNPLLGALLHAVGACSAALCYTPQKKTKAWAWQTYWLAQALVCWVILPVFVAWRTTPDLAGVVREAPPGVITDTMLLGALYGIGGTAFGIAIRYIGFSVTYAIAIGISCVLGTLLPPLLDGKISALLEQTGAGWVMAGVAVAAAGILVSGWAGWCKEKDLRASAALPEGFHLGKGLCFCVLAGILSAVFGLSLNAGKPLADLAAERGAGQFQGNVVYIFACGGAFLSTALYCIVLHLRHRTFAEYKAVDAPRSVLGLNYAMAILTGMLWYGQFFFYGLGHVRLGEKFAFSSWAIHMAMLVFFSAMAGLFLREWKGCSPRTWAALGAAILVLLLAVGLLTYGNYLGAQPAAGH